MVNKKAPDFALKDSDGKELKLSKIENKIILLDFFSAAKTCQKHVVMMEKINNKYKGKKDERIMIIGLTVQKDSERVQKFVKDNKLNYQIITSASKINKSYKIVKVPSLCAINKDGVIQFIYTDPNASDEKKVTDEIEKLLKTIPETRD